MIWRPLTLAAIIYLYLPLSPSFLCLFTALPKKRRFSTSHNKTVDSFSRNLPQPVSDAIAAPSLYSDSDIVATYMYLYTYSSLVANKVIAWGMNALSIQGEWIANHFNGLFRDSCALRIRHVVPPLAMRNIEISLSICFEIDPFRCHTHFPLLSPAGSTAFSQPPLLQEIIESLI